MQLVVVHGLPCTGKSQLIDSLRDELRWPMLTKDDFKERLFDVLGTADRAWSKRISLAAYELMFAQARQLLGCGISVVMEGNFRSDEHGQRFRSLANSNCDVLQVHCVASPSVLIERFKERAQSGMRHPGHVDMESLAEIEREMTLTRPTLLPIQGTIIECDTTVDWQSVIAVTKRRILSWAKTATSSPPRA